jgi:hypothetical protein
MCIALAVVIGAPGASAAEERTAPPSVSSYGCHQKSRARPGSQATSLMFTHS